MAFADNLQNKESIVLSTNYYFRIKDNAGQIWENPEIHIGLYAARSCLLRRQDHLYQSVSEMKEFFQRNTDRLVIVDECEREISWEQLQSNLLSSAPREGNLFIKDEDGYTWSVEDFC